MKKKVVLCNPKSNPGAEVEGILPYNILLLSYLLLQDGYTVELIDRQLMNLTDSEIIEKCKNAVCVGISAMTGYQIRDGIKVTDLVKEIYPNMPLIWGGAHPSLLPAETLAYKNIDIVVIGQGTFVLQELVNCIYYKKGISEVRGIAYKLSDGKIITNQRRKFENIENFQGYPFEILEIDYKTKKWSVIQYNSSEGCPWRCGFCANQIMYNRRWHGFNVEVIIRDIRKLIEFSGLRYIGFLDTNFFVDKNRTLNFARGLLKGDIGIQWSTSARSTQILSYSEDELRLLRDSGLINISVGMESGSDRLLNLMDKDVTAEQNLKCIDANARASIQTTGLFMIGLPTETLEERNLTKDSVRSMSIRQFCNFVLSVYTPYPGGKLFDIAVDNGFIPPKSLQEWGDFTQDKAHVPWLDSDFKWEYDSFIAEIASADRENDPKICRIVSELNMNNCKKIIIWGAALTGMLIMNKAQKEKIEVLHFTDGEEKKWNRIWNGLTIRPPLESFWNETDAVVIASMGYQNEIRSQIEKLNTKQIKVFGI